MWYSKPSILIIDDDPSISLLVKAKLGMSNSYDVKTIDNGFDGLKHAKKHTPNLILLDWIMPEMSGIETLKKIKSDPELLHVPVMMLTGENLIKNIEQAFSIGVDDYITKPLDLKKLISKVDKLIKT